MKFIYTLCSTWRYVSEYTDHLKMASLTNCFALYSAHLNVPFGIFGASDHRKCCPRVNMIFICKVDSVKTFSKLEPVSDQIQVSRSEIQERFPTGLRLTHSDKLRLRCDKLEIYWRNRELADKVSE